MNAPTAWHHKRAISMTRHLGYTVDATEPLNDLRSVAFADHEQRHGYERCDDRVLVNWLRHERTAYEWNLDTAKGRQGAVRSSEAELLAYEIIRSRHMLAIAERFPELAHACAMTTQSRYSNGTRVTR